MQELLKKLRELEKLVNVDKTFFKVMEGLQEINQINYDLYRRETNIINKGLANKKYLQDMSAGLLIEAEFFENASKIHELTDELFQEGGLVDQLASQLEK